MSARSEWLTVAAALGLLIVGGTLLRFFAGRATAAPWIVPDEVIYSHLARSFAATGHFAVRGDPFSALSYGPLYPIVLSPIYRLVGSLPQAYAIAKAVNAVLLSSAAVPAYLLARRVVERRPAFIAAVLAVAVPSGVYSTKLMTESLAFPIFLWTVAAITAAVDRPTVLRQATMFGAIAVAVLARAEMIALLPAAVSSIAFVAWLEARDKTGDGRPFVAELRRYRFTWAVLAIAVIGSIAALVRRPELVLGDHKVLSGRIDPFAAPLWAIYHFAELDLYAGVIPMIALFVLVQRVVRNPRESRRLTIFVSTSLFTTLSFLVLIAFYATQPTHATIFDRYDFYLLPLLFIACLAWLDRGIERPRVFGPLVVVLATLPLVLPYWRLFGDGGWGVNSASVGLVPLAYIRLATGTVFAVYPALVAAAALVVLVAYRARDRRPFLRLVVANVVVLSLFVQVGNAAVAHRALDIGVGKSTDRAWIDAAVGRDARVDVLWGGVSREGWKGWYRIWEAELFNRSVDRVYNFREPMRYRLPDRNVRVRNGRLFTSDEQPLRATYVLASADIPVRGKRVASDRATRMTLYRTHGAVTLR
jgi:hypothetical protein